MNRYTLYLRLYCSVALACFVIVAVISELLNMPVIFKYLFRIIASLAIIAIGVTLRQRIDLYRGEEVVHGTTRWLLPSIGVLSLLATFVIAYQISFKFSCAVNFVYALAFVKIGDDESMNKKEHGSVGRTTRYDRFTFSIELAVMCGLVYLFLYIAKL